MFIVLSESELLVFGIIYTPVLRLIQAPPMVHRGKNENFGKRIKRGKEKRRKCHQQFGVLAIDPSSRRKDKVGKEILRKGKWFARLFVHTYFEKRRNIVYLVRATQAVRLSSARLEVAPSQIPL